MTDVIDEKNLEKLNALNNEKVIKIVNEYVELCKPAKVTVITDSPEDIAYIRQLAIDNKEESKLAMEGHTIHYDGYNDQARDKVHTQVLLPKGKTISKHINTTDRDDALVEVKECMDGIMNGKEMLVRFFCLGPLNSDFSISCLQITDSSYVCHSEDILYRAGYEQFKNLKNPDEFFYFVHSAGELNENGNTVNIDKRRIYMDLEENRVFTFNNQYAGNSVGLKKLAMRLAINKSNNEDWLCEHMFVMGVHPLEKERVTYFTGAFPSACGKTATAMIPGQTIVGDDIAYLKIKDGDCYAANVEQGIFGIIADVNAVDDPLIYDCLTTPRELIFSNILTKDGKPYWLGMGVETPKEGKNHSGQWTEGKKDEKGNEITLAHKNARFTMRINELANADPKADDPEGVKVDAVIYGGRDSDTNVPVLQSLDWAQGVVYGAMLESETTAATLGKEGQRAHSPMANLDFLVVPLGKYLKNHLAFAQRLNKVPLVFQTNYFLKDEEGKYFNEKVDKKVWLLWAEGRVHGEYEAIETPIGHLPLFEDLNVLFKKVFDRDYSKEQYEKQFSIRIPSLLAKIERMKEAYADENVPEEFTQTMDSLKSGLEGLKEKFGEDVVLPSKFEE